MDEDRFQNVNSVSVASHPADFAQIIGEAAAPGFTIRNYQQLRNEFRELRPVVIDRICREGETVNIIASSKTGKSWLSVDLAMSVATGRDWLGRFSTTAGKVLLVDNELHPETLSDRVLSVQDARQYDVETLTERFHTVSCRGEVKDLFRLAASFERFEPREFAVVVLDAFYRFVPDGTSESDNQQMTSLYNLIDRLAARLRCAFVVIHHASKGAQGEKAVTDVGSGAGAMSRAADTHLVIRPHETEGYSVLDAATRSFPPLEPLSIYFEHPVWECSHIEPKVATRQTAAAQAREENDRASINQIVAKFGAESFTSYQVRTLLGGGQPKADRLIDVALKSGAIEESGTTTNKQKQDVTTYRAIRTEIRTEIRTAQKSSYEWRP